MKFFVSLILIAVFMTISVSCAEPATSSNMAHLNQKWASSDQVAVAQRSSLIATTVARNNTGLLNPIALASQFKCAPTGETVEILCSTHNQKARRAYKLRKGFVNTETVYIGDYLGKNAKSYPNIGGVGISQNNRTQR